MQIAKAATQEGNSQAAREVVLRIPALADYNAAQGDMRLLETLERADYTISGRAPLLSMKRCMKYPDMQQNGSCELFAATVP